MILLGTKKLLLAGIAMLVGASASTTFYLEQDTPHKTTKPIYLVTLAMTTNPDSTLVMVADRQGYFRDEGLEVATLHYSSGKAALETMLHGKAQLATVAETPIILNILRGENPMVIAGIFSSDRNMGVIARRDRGIRNPKDLRGKRIGIPLGTNADYFLHIWLAVEAVPIQKVTIINLPPEDMAKALASGKVDAVCIWHPFLAELNAQLGDKGINFSDENIYTYTFNIVATEKLINSQPQVILAFLRALEKAEKFTLEHPEKTRQIVANISHWNETLLSSVWQDFTFRLSLDPSLMMSMESQARWAMENNLVSQQEMPNSLDFIYLKGLQTVAPRDVTIRR